MSQKRAATSSPALGENPGAASSFSTREVAVLCARDRSVYHALPGCSVYDRTRDAFTFAGSAPVVAHPPCRLFWKLSHFAKPVDEANERALASFCVQRVQCNGGVLEHPAGSRLWDLMGLPRPGCSDEIGSTVAFPQYWFGHLGIKDTWVYVVGVRPRELPVVPFRLEAVDRRPVEFQSKRQREATPLSFALWLVEVARRSVVSVAQEVAS